MASRRYSVWFGRTVRCVWNGFAVVGIGLTFYHCCFHTSRVVSESMAPTLWGTNHDTGDLVLTEKLSYQFREPRRWEVVTFPASNGVVIMKRVVGLPGETITINRDRQVVIDGKPLEPPSEIADLRYFPYGNLTGSVRYECEAGYYVLGDDSRDSDDSRFNGVIRRNQIIGRAWAVLSPVKHWGWVNP